MWYKFENYADAQFPIYSSAQRRKGTVVGNHYHPALELLLICEGEPLLAIDTYQRRCKAGDLFLIPPYAVHFLEAEEECAIRGITFELSLVDPALCGADPQAVFARGSLTELVCGEEDPRYPCLRQAFDRLFEAYHTPSPARRAAIMSGIYGAMEALLLRFAPDAQEEQAYRRLGPAIDYMKEHLSEKITLEQLAGLLFICPEQCIRLFKERTHKTPMRYLTDLRLAEAMRLLAESELSIGQVASQCGFYSANHLAKTFKERLGKTPREYRRVFTKGMGLDIMEKNKEQQRGQIE